MFREVNPSKPEGWIPPPDEIFYFLTCKHASNTMKLLDFLNFLQPELLVPFLASFWWCGACQVSFREGLRRIYKAKIKIFSILDFYAHHFNSSGALENKYYAAKKWLESGLLYQDSIEHNIWGYMESPNWRLHGGVESTPPGFRSSVRARAS